jgi:CubicO group peptidase (beta-lactamase class C family)
MDYFNDLNQYTNEIKDRIAASAAAICVMKDNKILHEWYSGYHHFHKGARKVDVFSQFNVYSTRVTYVGLAAAIAIHDGAIKSLDEPISNYLMTYDSSILNNTTIRHLVTRTTGLQFQGDGVLRRFKAGTAFEGKRPEILAAIIKNATGKTVAELINKRVFEPLVITQSEWRTAGKESLVCDINDPNSYPTLRLESDEGSDRNLYVSARDLALWGNFHLNKGYFQGQQILPKELFDNLTSVLTPSSLPSHLPRLGSFWWIQDKDVKNSEMGSDLPEGSYQILGASGCSCTVIPKHKAVVVRMTNSLWTFGGKNGFDYISDIQRFGNLACSALNQYSNVTQ